MKTIIIPILAATLAALAFSVAAIAIALSGPFQNPSDPSLADSALPIRASPTPTGQAANASGTFQWLAAAAWTFPARDDDAPSIVFWPVFASPGGSAFAGLGLAVGSIIVILRRRSRIA